MSWSTSRTVIPRAGSARSRSAELEALVGVEARGRLVEQDEPRARASARATPTSLRCPVESSRGRRPPDLVELADLARPGDVSLVRRRRSANTRRRQEHVSHGRCEADPLGRDVQVLVDGQIVEQLDRLERPRDPPPREVVRTHARHVVAREEHAPDAGRW